MAQPPLERRVMHLETTEEDMDYRKLSNEITDVVVEALQHFDHIDRKGMPQAFEETQASIAGAVDRYRNDPIFRAKAQMLVARITTVIQNNETHNVEVSSGSEAPAKISAGSPSAGP